MKNNLLIFGTKNFNNSLDEIKVNLGFSLTYFNTDNLAQEIDTSVSAIIVENQICQNSLVLSYINKISYMNFIFNV